LAQRARNAHGAEGGEIMTPRIEILRAIIEAWKAKDVEAVLSHMDEDIVWHFAVAAEPPLRGKAQARKFLQRFGAGMNDIRWRVFDYLESGDRLFVEGVDEFRTDEGRTVMAPYAGVLDFRGDLVLGWRDYVDVGVMAAQRGGAAVTDQVKSLVDRAAVF
jgi:limonene-1,2-epoxide hydrolase